MDQDQRDRQGEREMTFTVETEFEWMRDQGGPDWARIQRGLARPFDPSEVEWRIDGGAWNQGGRQVARVLAYVKRDALLDRLDQVVGLQYCQIDLVGLVEQGGHIPHTKATITIHGVSRSDFGSARGDVSSKPDFEGAAPAGGKMAAQRTKAGATDAAKRVGTAWGVARYLARMGRVTAAVEAEGRGLRITDAAEAELEARLARWDGKRGTFPDADKAAGLSAARTSNAQDSRSQGQQATRSNQGGASPRQTPAPTASAAPVAQAPTQAPARAAAPSAQTPSAPAPSANEPPATEQQVIALRKLALAIGDGREVPAALTYDGARKLITGWSAVYQQKKRAS